MTNKEFKEFISKTSEPKWFHELEVNINYPHINFSQMFKGVVGFYEFLNQQIKGWEKYDINSIPPNLTSNKEHFISLKNNLLTLVNNYHNYHQNQLTQHWNNVKRSFESNSHPIFLYNVPETGFLINLFNTKKQFYTGAYNFIVGNINIIQSDKNNYIGGLLAYEFLTKDLSHIVERKKEEKISLDKLRNDFQKYLSESGKQLTEHLSNSNTEFQSYVSKIDKLTEEKNNSFETWFSNIQTLFSEFNSTSNQKIKDLESLYSEKLMLEKPAEYWNKRANELRTTGNWWLFGLIMTTVAGSITLFCLIYSISDSKTNNFIQTGNGVRALIGYVTLISFIAFLIRTFTKLTFSTFHLVRDAEERKQLAYVYLSLKEQGAVSDADRQIILQSVFSRADSGLLKEDSSPTMPSSIIDKLPNQR